MKFRFSVFLRDRIWECIVDLVLLLILFLFMMALRARTELVIFVMGAVALMQILNLLIDFWRRRKFYAELWQNIAGLDQKYLVMETLERPTFLEGKIVYDALYEVDKSMAENVAKYEELQRSFQEYIELWIHEVKTPITTLNLLAKDRREVVELQKLDSCVERVLYYVRAENAEHDYIIRSENLAKVVGRVLQKNRVALQTRRIEIEVSELDKNVYTDAMWLEFIINQIIANSMKYEAKKITIRVEQKSQGEVILQIIDDGIGISAKDLPRVYEKSFTGTNGHFATTQATGMGLYLVKNLCQKLGHKIEISSEEKRFTCVEISFYEHDYYETARKVTKK